MRTFIGRTIRKLEIIRQKKIGQITEMFTILSFSFLKYSIIIKIVHKNDIMSTIVLFRSSWISGRNSCVNKPLELK